MPVFRVAIASPLRKLFDYLPPENLDSRQIRQMRPGIRLLLPFGNRQVAGILVEITEQSALPMEKLRPAVEPIDEHPIISKPLLKLCLWAANYYKHPPGEILAAALPTRLRKGEIYQPARQLSWQLSVTGKGLPTGALQRAPRQAQLLALLQQHGQLADEALTAAALSRAVIRQMHNKGLIEPLQTLPATQPPVCHPGLSLKQEQQRALTVVAGQLDGFGSFLLEGVTGSGKTEVYLQLIARVLATGRQALVLIPEIGLTPQTLQRFQRRFDAHIVVLHSGLTDRARLQAWDEARSGRAHIVLGTRSSIYTPLHKPGLIVVDEEHDSSFKQQEGFRYSARDVAVKRAQLENIPVLLGSATPSLESLNNALAGRYQHLHLRERAAATAHIEFSTVDVRHKALQGGMSAELVDAIRQQLHAQNQVLLFLNRRGYAPTLQCHDCGFIAGCRHCDARLSLHLRARELRCHHCDWRTQVPQACPQCHSSKLIPAGVGTERAESVLREQFPDTPLYRVDRDSMQRKGAMESVLASVHSGQACILLGTQMLTKGHHFPDVTLVGLLDTDAALFSADFRGPERTGQLLTQVAGRAGRASKPGRVLLQTHYPDHPQLQLLLAGGYGDYARSLLEDRRRSHMPPFGYLILLRADAGSAQQAEDFLATLRGQGEQSAGNTAQFVGPIPAPLQRKRGRFRAQLLVSCRSRKATQACADRLVAHAESLPSSNRLRWSLDRDPQDMM